MLAAHIHAPEKIKLIEVDEPKLSGKPAPGQPGEIIFQVECACLCGSDLPYFEMAEECGGPRIGHSLHEMIGSVIETTGTKFKKGDRVLTVPVEQQGFYERYAVSEDRAIPLDTRVPEEHALLAQPLGTVIYALKKLPSVLDQDVVVVGQGPIGQMFNMVLRNFGAREIIGIDLLPERLAHSKETGATHAICNAAQDPVAEVKRILDGRLADIVIEAVGHRDQAMNVCIDLCRHSGRMLYFGVPPEHLDRVRWRDLFRKNLTVHTSVDPDFRRDFPLAMRWIGEGRVDIGKVITHRFPLKQTQEAFETFHQRKGGALKVLLEFPSWKGSTVKW